MNLTLSMGSPIPLYRQIHSQLRGAILSGALKPGDPLPSEAQICRQTGVSRMTARQALELLANEGLVVRHRGRGTFVASPKALLTEMEMQGLSYTEIMGRAGLRVGAQVLEQRVETAPAHVRAPLRLDPGARVVRVVRIRSAGEMILSLETSYYPHARFPGLEGADLQDESILRYLQEHYDLVPAYALDTLEIEAADEQGARALGIPPGAPIARVTTVSYLQDDTPVAYAETIHRGDCFRATLRRSRRRLP
jgi:GntR family transcriptional regulator